MSRRIAAAVITTTKIRNHALPAFDSMPQEFRPLAVRNIDMYVYILPYLWVPYVLPLRLLLYKQKVEVDICPNFRVDCKQMYVCQRRSEKVCALTSCKLIEMLRIWKGVIVHLCKTSLICCCWCLALIVYIITPPTPQKYHVPMVC